MALAGLKRLIHKYRLFQYLYLWDDISPPIFINNMKCSNFLLEECCLVYLHLKVIPGNYKGKHFLGEKNSRLSMYINRTYKETLRNRKASTWISCALLNYEIFIFVALIILKHDSKTRKKNGHFPKMLKIPPKWQVLICYEKIFTETFLLDHFATNL